MADETDTLKNYLEIQQLRFGKQFNYSLDIDESIDTETYAIPPMLAQPFIENAIEHGLVPLKEKGEIDINFKLEDKKVIKLIIIDNGIGIKRSMQDNGESTKKRKSLATVLTMTRLKHLKQQHKGNIFLKIDDLSDEGSERGTRVTLQIPYQRIYG